MIKRILRKAFTFAEALVLVIIVGSCMVPILGTLQSGAERTQDLNHRTRMRMICETRLNEVIASATYLRQPLDTGETIIPWPADNPIATYILTVTAHGNPVIDSLSGPSDDLVGTQPINIKGVLVSVALQNDDPNEATETVKLGTLLGITVSSNPGSIYLNDPRNLKVFSLDPEALILKEVIDIPRVNLAKPVTDGDQDPNRPGNIAVYPSDKWVALQQKYKISLLEVDKDSSTHGRVVEVYATTAAFLEDPKEPDKSRKDRGIAFRPDGRFCAVTAHESKSFCIFSVPKTLPASFTLVKSFSLANQENTDLAVGNDGYVYLADKDNTNKCVNRVNMYTNAGLENYFPSSTWLNNTGEPIAVAVTPNGRKVLQLIKNGPDSGINLVWSDSWVAPVGTFTSGIITRDSVSGGDLRDVEISADGNYAIASSKKGGTNTRIYCVSLPLVPSTIGPLAANYAIPPNNIAYPGENEKTNLVVKSPYLRDVLVDRQNNGQTFFLNVASLAAGVYGASIPAQRKVVFSNVASGIADVSHISARIPAEILIGCSNSVSNHKVEFLDLYAETLRIDKVLTLNAKPNDICVNGSGVKGAYAPWYDIRTFEEIDLYDKVLSGNTLGATANADYYPKMGEYTLDDGYIDAREPKPGNLAPGSPYQAYRMHASNSTLLTAGYLVLPATVTDILPLNNGGAMVLIGSGSIDSASRSTELHWIASNGQVLARFDSRYDNFPPNGVTRMALSANDGLLALYDPAGTGATADSVYFYDLRSQDFASLTQQMGLIVMNHTGLREGSQIKDFTTPLYAPSPFNAKNCLTKNYNCGDPAPPVSLFDYPCGFTGSLFGGNGDFEGHNGRWFGYFYPSIPISRCGWINDDYSRFFIDGQAYSVREQNAEDRWLIQPPALVRYNSIMISLPDPQSHSFQFEIAEDQALSYSGDSSFSYTGNVGIADGINSNPFVVKDSVSSNFYTPLASSACRPFRFSPQFLSAYGTGADNYSGDSGSIVFSRDVASPTLFFLNRSGTPKLRIIPFGGVPVVKTLPSTGYADMVVSPDDFRLVLAANSPVNRLEIIDISVPATGTYGANIATISLSVPPTCLASRRFNRHWLQHDTYEQAATMSVEMCGQSIAAVASGGIYIAGGPSNISGAATDAIFLFDPIVATFSNLGSQLRSPIKAHSVVNYDGAIYTFGGHDGTASTAYVQSWNPTTQGSLYSPDAISASKLSLDNMTSASQGGHTASACHESSGKPGYQAFGAGSWRLNDSNWPHRLDYNFGSAVIVSEILLKGTTGFGPPKDFDILAATATTWAASGTDYFHIYSGTMADNTSLQTFPCATTSAYQYYRLSCKSPGYDSPRLGLDVMEYWGGTGNNFGTHLSSASTDLPTSYVARMDLGGCQTPYGMVIGGGFTSTSWILGTTTVSLYWPHAIASPSPNLRWGISRQLPSMPNPVRGHSFVWHKGFLYRIGGASGATIRADIDKFSFETNTWTTPSLSDPSTLFKRVNAGVCSFGDEIFIFGGQGPTIANISATAAAWNPNTGTVRQITNFPQTRNLAGTLGDRWFAPCAVPCGEHIYIIGGAVSFLVGGGSREILRYTP